MRVPSPRIFGSSERVQQTLHRAVDHEVHRTERCEHCRRAGDGVGRPVDRTGTGADWRGVGTTTWIGGVPSRSSASSAKFTLTALLWLSDRIAALWDGSTPHISNTDSESVDPLGFDSFDQHRGLLCDSAASTAARCAASLKRRTCQRRRPSSSSSSSSVIEVTAVTTPTPRWPGGMPEGHGHCR